MITNIGPATPEENNKFFTHRVALREATKSDHPEGFVSWDAFWKDVNESEHRLGTGAVNEEYAV